jgi:hypothetical protein
VASVTFAPPTRTFDPPDLIVLAAVAALAAAKAVHRFRQLVQAPLPSTPASSAVEPGPAGLVPFDEDLMDRFLTAPADVCDPDAGRLRRLQARRSAGAEAQWRTLAQ